MARLSGVVLEGGRGFEEVVPRDFKAPRLAPAGLGATRTDAINTHLSASSYLEYADRWGLGAAQKMAECRFWYSVSPRSLPVDSVAVNKKHSSCAGGGRGFWRGCLLAGDGKEETPL